MKTFPVPSPLSSHASRASTVALLSLALGLAGASAQTPATTGTGADTSGSTGSRSGTTDATGSSATVNSAASGSYGAASVSATPSSAATMSASLDRGDKRFLNQAADSSEREVAISQLAAQRASNPQVRSYAQHLVSDHEQLNQAVRQLAQQKGVTLEGESLSSGQAPGMSGGTTAEDNTSGTGTAGGARSVSTTGTSSNASIQPGLGTDDTHGRSYSTFSGGGSRPAATTGASTAYTSDRHYRSLESKTGTDFDQEYLSLMVREHKSDVKLFQKEAQDANDPDVRSFASQHVAALQSHLDQANSLEKSAAE